MFLFSKKLLLLFVVVALLFGGERQLAEALKCYTCAGASGACDVDQTGGSEECPAGNSACCRIKTGATIVKRCEADDTLWQDGGKPKCVEDACYCITDNCNKPKDFGMDHGSGGTGGGGAAGGGSTTAGNSPTNGAIGTSRICSAWLITVAMMAIGIGPSIFIAQ
ncbi:unnamed protein product [Orchesella dallaii]|uniref:Uncharacterized protein n=1 Tax=Orchesella dallaii TaxID=48710 RepID=A0ABP1PJ15_9HEXA